MASGGGGGGGEVVAAPFVLKTYRMVDDPSTDEVIYWGRDNNSFIVADPFAISRTLLPAHFKHNNFSSFVRQLNTYGFRKVEPDRWEFAHASFLRGQTHLLHRIVRRSGGGGGGGKRKEEEGWEEVEEGLAVEVATLKQEQRKIEERLQGMWRRVQETERRPKQMLAFLLRVVGNPGVVGGVERGEKRLRLEGGGGGGEGSVEGASMSGDGEDGYFEVGGADQFRPAAAGETTELDGGGGGHLRTEFGRVEMGTAGYPYSYLADHGY